MRLTILFSLTDFLNPQKIKWINSIMSIILGTWGLYFVLSSLFKRTKSSMSVPHGCRNWQENVNTHITLDRKSVV